MEERIKSGMEGIYQYLRARFHSKAVLVRGAAAVIGNGMRIRDEADARALGAITVILHGGKLRIARDPGSQLGS